ncbi:hypothetical protein LXL04_019025 [Taraxacum kok-saghyz]
MKNINKKLMEFNDIYGNVVWNSPTGSNESDWVTLAEGLFKAKTKQPFTHTEFWEMLRNQLKWKTLESADDFTGVAGSWSGTNIDELMEKLFSLETTPPPLDHGGVSGLFGDSAAPCPLYARHPTKKSEKPAKSLRSHRRGQAAGKVCRWRMPFRHRRQRYIILNRNSEIVVLHKFSMTCPLWSWTIV